MPGAEGGRASTPPGLTATPLSCLSLSGIQDFGLVRLLQMLWRLNFLVILLCMSLNNTYILYYICPLHTFYFFVVFITMRIFPQKNHGKWDIRFKIMTLALAIFFIWEAFDGQVFGWIFSLFLSQEPCIGAKSGALWEWYFRTSLDNWSTILGMIFALNFPLAMKWLTKIEEQPMRQQVLSKGLVGVVVGSVFVWWVTNVFMQSKLQYNLTNSYYGFIPLLAYVYFRNVSFTLRSYYLGTLHDLGKITLESYLMQHHIWLTSNAKTLLVLLPGYPKVNETASLPILPTDKAASVRQSTHSLPGSCPTLSCHSLFTSLSPLPSPGLLGRSTCSCARSSSWWCQRPCSA